MGAACSPAVTASNANARDVEGPKLNDVTPTVEGQRAVLEALLGWATDERSFGLVTAAVGAVWLLAALVLWLGWARPWTVGAAVPLVLLGLIDVIVGGEAFVSASRHLEDFPIWVREAPHLVEEQAVPRLQARARGARWSALVQTAGAVLGLGLLTRRGRWRGVGLGLTAACLVDVGLERLAEARASAALVVLSAHVLGG
jgi:hypothetical protein